MYETLIKVDNLCKYFQTKNREICALKDVNFEVNQGESVGLIGVNGSGKTTLLKLLAGIIHPSKGTIKIRGKSLPLLELGVGFHPELTGMENIFLYSSILGMPKNMIKTKMNEIIEFSELSNFIEEKLRTYSMGMKLRLAFSVGVQCNNDIFLIDEVLAVGDLGFQRKCIKKIKELKEGGKTVIFASHNFKLTNKICDRAILLDKGRTKFMGDVLRTFYKYEDMLKICKKEK